MGDRWEASPGCVPSSLAEGLVLLSVFYLISETIGICGRRRRKTTNSEGWRLGGTEQGDGRQICPCHRDWGSRPGKSVTGCENWPWPRPGRSYFGSWSPSILKPLGEFLCLFWDRVLFCCPCCPETMLAGSLSAEILGVTCHAWLNLVWCLPQTHAGSLWVAQPHVPCSLYRWSSSKVERGVRAPQENWSHGDNPLFSGIQPPLAVLAQNRWDGCKVRLLKINVKKFRILTPLSRRGLSPSARHLFLSTAAFQRPLGLPLSSPQPPKSLV